MLRWLPVLVLLALAGSPALAQGVAFGGMRADPDAPVEIAADALSVDQAAGTAVFSGDVAIGQGTMRLGADRVTVAYAGDDRSRIRTLTATGTVTLVSGEDAAEAAEAVYDVEAGVVTLAGDVLLRQGGNVLRGDRMRVDLATGSAEVEGRVRSVLQPGGN